MDSFVDGEKVIEIDEKDVNTPDEWISRHPEIIRLTGRHPLNCEPPLSKLMNYGFITPASLHYVRNHGAVPRLEWDSHTISVGGLVGKKVELKMDDLISRFEIVSLPVTLVCCGNRRKEQNMYKKTIGFNWGAAGVSTSIWTGVRLRDVLTFCQIKESDEGANHVCFAGADALPGGCYGTSITRNVAMDPLSDVLLAWEQNGEPLLPDHGFPLRLIVPGYIGGRMVKWLKEIEVTNSPSENYYHNHDNKVLPPQIDAERAKLEGWWYKPDYTVNELNINSVITSPAHDETIQILSGINSYKFKGYAYTGGGRKVIRVELSFDDGASWELCDLNHPEIPSKSGKYYCWCFWELDTPVSNLLRCAQVMVRAWDSAQNTQPINMTWNVMGMMNNCTFKILVHLVQLGPNALSLSFEHPTLPGTQQGGWMSSQHNDTSVQAISTKELQAEHNAKVKYFTLKEVQKHTTKESCWFIHKNQVYDSTSFLKDHPGGGESILLVAGGDATEEFDSLHSEKAHKLLQDFYIGELTNPDLFLQSEEKNQVMSRNLYEKLGGAAAISAVVNLFYDEKVLKDQRLQPIFDGKDIVSLRNHQVMFLSFVLGGSNEYCGRSMRDAHRGLGITELHWNVICQHLVSSLEELGVSNLDITCVIERVLPLKNEVIEPNDTRETVGSISEKETEPSTLTALRKQKSSFTLTEREEVTHNTRRLRFALASPHHIIGLPVGQHLFISAKIDGSTCIRAYTPLTGNEVKGYFDLLIKVYFKNEHPNFPEGGKMSQFLNNLQIGDSIEARGPVGHIEYKGNGTFQIDGQAVSTTNICMLAGGTGITPMYQVMAAILREPNDRTNLSLVYANNTEDDILLEPELERFANKPNCKVFHTLAKPKTPSTWKGGVGFITQSMLIEHLGLPSEDTLVFMCGPPPMLKFACLPSLEALGYNMSKCFTF